MILSNSELTSLSGLTIRWIGFVATHQQLRMLASSSAVGFLQIDFVGVCYIDLIPVMHGAKLRLAPETDRTSMLKIYELPFPSHLDFWILDCDEGRFSLCSGPVQATVLSQPDLDFLITPLLPLWDVEALLDDPIGHGKTSILHLI